MAVKKATTGVDTHGKGHLAGRAAGLRLKNRRRRPTGTVKANNHPALLQNHRNNKGEMSGQELYEQVERLARQADKSGGPLPVALLQKAASTGYPPAVYALANWHLHGKGVKKDRKQAVRLLKKAAAREYPAAEYDLAVSYELGKGGLPKDPKTAFVWYRRAANNGDRDAMTEVGRCYYHGIGTKKDLAKAVAWYSKAADLGDSDAKYALGVAYEYGEGVEKNLRTARQWYKEAAEQGDAEAAKALAELEAGGPTR